MESAAPPGLIADRYELGGLLGRGGMGEVREGVDRRLGRPVAVKLLRRDLAAENELRRRFEAEARAAAGLSHPNVVAVYDTGEHDGVPYIVMERLSGRTMADEIEAGPLSAREVERLAQQVLAALDAAHQAGVVHRDIKPRNLLLTPESSVKVTDFGIAKVAEGLELDVTVTGQVLGTPAYLAPERLSGQPATARSDLFSLGVVLYEALSGTKPFSGSTPWEMAHALGSGEHRPLDEVVPGLPPRLVRTVERAMRKDPEDRFPTAADMARSLEDTDPPVSATRSVSATRPASPTVPMAEPPAAAGPSQRLRRFRAARWRAGAALAVAAVVLLLTAVWLAGDRSPGDDAPATPPTAGAPVGGLPESLDRAIDELEESVRR